MMIKKLDPYYSSRTSIDCIHWEVRPNLEDVINKVNEIIDAVNANSLGFSVPIGSVVSRTNNPSKDIKKNESVKHGRWLKSGQNFMFPSEFLNYFCSECGYELDKSIRTKYNYCPNCGALMDEGK